MQKNVMDYASHVVYTGHLPLSCVVASMLQNDGNDRV